MADLAISAAVPEQGGRKSASHGEAGYARREHDAYFTPAWVTRALLDTVEFTAPDRNRTQTLIWEPACGDGRMAREIEAAGYQVAASDIADWGYGSTGVDFFDPIPPNGVTACSAIITNPPFGTTARLFIQRALKFVNLQRGKVAMLQRHEFDAPVTNHPLFVWPFAQKLVLPRRPKWSDEDKASPRFPYAWYVWDWRHEGPPILRYLSTVPASMLLMTDHNRHFCAARLRGLALMIERGEIDEDFAELAAETGLDLVPLPGRARIVESIRRFAEQYERRGE